MTYTPITAKEAAKQEEANKPKPLDPGIYDFEVYHAEDKTSTTGNAMKKIDIKVYTNDGSYRFVNDYLVHTDKMEYKVRYAADACGLLKEYESGKLTASDFIGRCGKVQLGIQAEKDKGDGTGDKWPAKNIIKAYIKKSDAKTDLTKGLVKQPLPTSDEELNDEIPF